MKPRIQELFDAFQKYTSAISKNCTEQTWLAVREELRRDLDKLGIADHFDWSL